jgi:GntR family transcriptional regulator, transcriptional repressor for pyruvate dehydrogenase complex
VFQQVKQSRVFQDVVDQIQEAIVQGKLAPGSRLPAERELTDIFKASRGTLREALRVLEQKGLISIKTGVKGGAVVNILTTHQFSESLDLLIRYQRVSLRDLAEFREGVEGMVAALAAQRATKEDIRHLKTLLNKAGQCLDQGTSGWDAFIRMDNQIHMSLARMAGNPMYESVLQTIYDNIHRYFDRFLPREEKIIQENYQDLCAIVSAVEKGDANEASLLVQDHVFRFNRRMEKNAEGAEKTSKDFYRARI